MISNELSSVVFQSITTNGSFGRWKISIKVDFSSTTTLLEYAEQDRVVESRDTMEVLHFNVPC